VVLVRLRTAAKVRRPGRAGFADPMKDRRPAIREGEKMKKHIVVGALAVVLPALPLVDSVVPWSSASVFAQTAPRFESATVKHAATGAPHNRVMPASPDRLSIPSMNITWLIYTAYQEGMGTGWNVTGVPGRLDLNYYAIEGRAAQPSTQR